MADAPQGEGVQRSLEAAQIMDLLPHRFPFLMVDRVLEMEPGKSIKAIKAVSANEPWVQGHFPGMPIMPGVLMIEALAQVGGIAVVCLEENRGKLAVLGGAESVRVRHMVRPGDVMVIEAEVLYMKMGASRIKGSISVRDEVVMTGEIIFKTLDP